MITTYQGKTGKKAIFNSAEKLHFGVYETKIKYEKD